MVEEILENKISSTFLLNSKKMIGNHYGYGLIDSSYIISRNAFAVSSGKKPGEYTAGDIVRCTIQTLNKICRDYPNLGVDKFVLLADKWDPTYKGYWRTQLLSGKYKDTRGDGKDENGRPIYIDMNYWNSIKDDPTISNEEKEEIHSKAYFNDTKQKAKRIIQNDLSNFGIPCIGVYGWEADDLVYLCAGLLYTGNPSVKPNVIITKDTDQYYSLSPELDLFRIPTGKSEPKVVTYEEMYNTIPDFLKGRISLYDYHAYMESLGNSHNDMRPTKAPGIDINEAIAKLLDGDTSVLSDVEQFKLNMSTFNIGAFPRFEEARRLVTEILPTAGKLGNLREFHDFCDKYSITGISDKYFTEFISRFDTKLFSER